MNGERRIDEILNFNPSKNQMDSDQGCDLSSYRNVVPQL